MPDAAAPDGTLLATPPAAAVVPATVATPASADPAAPAKPDAAPAKADVTPQVPAKYEFKLPDGLSTDAASKLEAEFVPLAREAKLSNEQAQKLVDLYTAQVSAQAKAGQDAWAATVEGWRKAAKEDPEFGGAKLEATVKDAQRILKQFGDKDLTNWIEETHLGDHPAFLRFMAKLGRTIKEDTVIAPRPGAGGGGEAVLSDLMYPGGGKA